VVIVLLWKQTRSRIPKINRIIQLDIRGSGTYGHSQLKTGHPVRSAIHKQLNGRLVLRWVTTWESLLLYVLHFFCSPAIFCRALSALTQSCNSLGPCWLGQLISSMAALTESEDQPMCTIVKDEATHTLPSDWDNRRGWGVSPSTRKLATKPQGSLTTSELVV
jgi:hypothetical protein